MRRPPVKRRRSDEHLIRDDAQRVEIGAVVGGGVAGRLLGRHVRRSADRCADMRRDGGRRADRRTRRRHDVASPRLQECLGDSEVGDGGRSAREQDVVGFDVAVNDATPVSVHERARHVFKNAHGLAHRERAALQARADRLALDERHDEEGQAVHLSGAQHGYDVRVLERSREHDLALEPRNGHRRRQLVRQHLDGYLSPERVVARDEHRRHTPATELPLEREGVSQRTLELVPKTRHREAAD